MKTQQNQHTQEYTGISAHRYTLTHMNADEVKVDSGEKISMFFAAVPEKHANEAMPAVMTGALS